MTLRIVPKTKLTSTLELDHIGWGVLPNRTLPPSFYPGHQTEIGREEWDGLCALLLRRAVDILLDYLARAEHSEFQCRGLLRRRGFHPSLCDQALARCTELGYLDNSRYAEMLISSQLSRGASRRALIAKLRLQRIPAEIWEPLLADIYDKESAKESLRDAMLKYYATHSGLPRPKLKEKIFSHFFRKGFELDDIRSAWEDLNRP